MGGFGWSVGRSVDSPLLSRPPIHYINTTTTINTGGLPSGHRGEPDRAPHPPRRRHARPRGDGAHQPLQVRRERDCSFVLVGIDYACMWVCYIRSIDRSTDRPPPTPSPPFQNDNRTSIKKDVVVYQYDVAISEASGRPIEKLPAAKARCSLSGGVWVM